MPAMRKGLKMSCHQDNGSDGQPHESEVRCGFFLGRCVWRKLTRLDTCRRELRRTRTRRLKKRSKHNRIIAKHSTKLQWQVCRGLAMRMSLSSFSEPFNSFSAHSGTALQSVTQRLRRQNRHLCKKHKPPEPRRHLTTSMSKRRGKGGRMTLGAATDNRTSLR